MAARELPESSDNGCEVHASIPDDVDAARAAMVARGLKIQPVAPTHPEHP